MVIDLAEVGWLAGGAWKFGSRLSITVIMPHSAEYTAGDTRGCNWNILLCLDSILKYIRAMVVVVFMLPGVVAKQ